MTIEWFAATVRELTGERTTAEQLGVDLRKAVMAVCAPEWVDVTIVHHEKDGVVLTIEA